MNTNGTAATTTTGRNTKTMKRFNMGKDLATASSIYKGRHAPTGLKEHGALQITLSPKTSVAYSASAYFPHSRSMGNFMLLQCSTIFDDCTICSESSEYSSPMKYPYQGSMPSA